MSSIWTSTEAQEVVDDLNAAEVYLPDDELRSSLKRAANYIAEQFDVVSDDTELEFSGGH